MLRLRIAIIEIIEYLRTLDTVEERFIIGEAVGTVIANKLTDGSLEYHDEYKRIMSRITRTIATAVQEVLLEMDNVSFGGQCLVLLCA